MDVLLGGVHFWSVKLAWVKKKTRIALAPRHTTFTSTSTKTTPWSLWLFGRLGCLSWNGLLGWKNFDITEAMAPNLARSFVNFGDILSNIVKDRMGRWEGCSGTFLYVGICRVSKIKRSTRFMRELKKITKPAGQNMYQGTLQYCIHETSELFCKSTRNIESLKIKRPFFSIVMYCSVL